MIHIIRRTQLVIQYLSLVNMWCGMNIAQRQSGGRIVIGQDRRLSLPSACTLSCVIVRRSLGSWLGKLLSPYTCSVDWFRVRFTLRQWMDEGPSCSLSLSLPLSLSLSLPLSLSLSGRRLRRDYLSEGLDWGGPIPFGLTLDLLSLHQHISSCAIYMWTRFRSLHVARGISSPNLSPSSIH